MLKALDDLERAVSRMVEKTREKALDDSVSGPTEEPVRETAAIEAVKQPEQPSGEAAELIRRAIKRLKSL